MAISRLQNPDPNRVVFGALDSGTRSDNRNYTWP
jgi:hypothetical protein